MAQAPVRVFPDETGMPRSVDGSEPIRGGSIALNRILGHLVESRNDRNPQAKAVLLSAFTIYANVWGSTTDHSLAAMETGFIQDLNLFLDYYDIYLSHVWNPYFGEKFCPVIVYFPDYHTLEKELRRELTGDSGDAFAGYVNFMKKQNIQDGEVRKLEHVRCMWITAGAQTYPHREVVRKFREVTHHQDCLYTSGDPIWLMSHIPLDFYMAKRVRGIQILQRHTGKVVSPDSVRLKFDRGGRVPWMTTTHVVFGDGVLIGTLLDRSSRKVLLDDATTHKWMSRSEEEIRQRIIKLTKIPPATLRKYDFI